MLLRYIHVHTYTHINKHTLIMYSLAKQQPVGILSGKINKKIYTVTDTWDKSIASVCVCVCVCLGVCVCATG